MLIKRTSDYVDEIHASLQQMKVQPPKNLVKTILTKYSNQLRYYIIHSRASLYIANKLSINTRYNQNSDTRKPHSEYYKYILNNKL